MKKKLKLLSMICVAGVALAVATGCASTGPKGEQGDVGPQGPQGPQGPSGSQGEQGSQGTNGQNGLSAYEIYKKYHPVYKGSEEQWINALADGSLAKSYNTTYNFIFTIATIPPVLSAVDCIGSGNATYAVIERGKTYCGIEEVDNFDNLGFDVTVNNSAGLSSKQFNDSVAKVKELNVFGNEKFKFYISDANFKAGFMMAANAGLDSDKFEVVIIEDGRSAYSSFSNNYILNKEVSATVDEPYDIYSSRVEAVKSDIDEIMSKTDNVWNPDVNYSLRDAWACAAIDNCTYWLQSQTRFENLIKSKTSGNVHTKLATVFGIDGYDDSVDFEANVKYESISEALERLTNTQKESYLNLMFGQYYENTNAALTRTTLSDNTTPVPAKKLVYIGNRVRGFPATATNAALGIGGATSAADVPDSYAALDAKYKTALLFPTQADYEVFINKINDDSEYSANITQDQKDAVRVGAFNYYINYAFALKLTYLQYGNDYDIIMKGHPSEDIDEPSKWSAYTAGGYTYSLLMNHLIVAFHNSDSIGKKIGRVPYGTAAENLAYVGADLSIGGGESSTYTGYDPSIDVKFILQPGNGNVASSSNIGPRYEDGTLQNHTASGEEDVTSYFNTGVILKTLVEYYTEISNSELVTRYTGLYENWLRTVNGLATDADVTGYGVDVQGFLIKPEQA